MSGMELEWETAAIGQQLALALEGAFYLIALIVPPQVVELNGQWRKSQQSRASRPNIRIREHYTDLWVVLDQLLEFSRFL